MAKKAPNRDIALERLVDVLQQLLLKVDSLSSATRRIENRITLLENYAARNEP